ncbi:CD81 antigen isoform X2 [Episyrphus balteatus]|uniref:CD81 antigen isoform X2 n=1 Tax=Episyrphus balteatus TaxID=286459 RepID=UPI002484DF57|nr:CD81 antigen isoform X2 [Episyrphus balteatus]
MSFLCCVKYLVIIFSCLYWIFGAFIITGCLWILNDPMFSLMFTQSGGLLKYTVYLILFAGCLTLLNGWFACYSILKRSTCMIAAFIFILVIIVGLKIAAGAWISYNKDRISDLLTASAKYSIQHEYGQMSTTTVTFDVIQKNLKCCGADGPTDWMASQYNNVGGNDLTNIAFSSLNVFYSIPESCCSQDISEVVCEIARKRKLDANLHAGINKEGCVRKLTDIASTNSGLVFITFIGAISLEIFVVGLSLVLCCDLFRNQNKNEMNS